MDTVADEARAVLHTGRTTNARVLAGVFDPPAAQQIAREWPRATDDRPPPHRAHLWCDRSAGREVPPGFLSSRVARAKVVLTHGGRRAGRLAAPSPVRHESDPLNFPT
jgi:hypothetical protein